MSNPLKRILNSSQEDEEYDSFNNYATMAPYVYPFSQQALGPPQGFDIDNTPRWSSSLGPTEMNTESGIPILQSGDSMQDFIGGIFHSTNGCSIQPDASGLGYDIELAMTEWVESTESPNSFGQLQLSTDPSREQSYTLSIGSSREQSQLESTSSSREQSDSQSSDPSREQSYSQSRDSSCEQPFSQSTTPLPSQTVTEPNTATEDNEIICYGMLHDVEAKLTCDTQIIYSKIGKTAPVFDRFKLEKQDSHIVLCFRDDNTSFGYLRSGVGNTLEPILREPDTELEPIAFTNSLREQIGRANKSAAATVKIDINVYGPCQNMANVGGRLSNGKLWLQNTGHARPGVRHDNPHFLPIKIDGVEMQITKPVNQAAKDVAAKTKLRKDQLSKMVEEVYKSVDNSRELEQVKGGHMIASELLRHQQEALAFMLERESGNINDRYRLWRPIYEEGRELYLHRITKARREVQPDESGGGILADEMGMGKSLSILALVTKTLDDGEKWAQQQNESAEGKKTLKYSRSTLVVVSSALLINNWTREIERHLKPGIIRAINYHGPNRPKDVEEIQDSDIVITTYNTLTSEYLTKKEDSCLHNIGWYRIVLDEAHIIRRPATAFHRVCFDLQGNSRWCLTGTPVQNKLADIGALFTFIRVEPFSKQSVFRKWIELPFEQSLEYSNAVKDRLIILLEALCLRRTKDVITLPGLRQCIRTLEFTSEEREQYNKTKRVLMRTIRQRVGEIEKSSKFGLFQANLQMRILCNHGTFQKPFSWHRRSYQDEREAIGTAYGDDGKITCSGCQQPMPIIGSSHLSNGFREHCAHVLCSECIEESSFQEDGERLPHCPVCVRWPGQVQRTASAGAPADESMESAHSRVAIEDSDDLYFNPEGRSTKMLAVIEDVRKDLHTTKSIIFSCWTRSLHLLARLLSDANIPYLSIDGGCPLSLRQTRLDKFAKDKETPVLLMTTGTGAFGLNLTCANRVFIVELQWNPAVENQAIARAIRLGQEEEVHVTRYVIKDTVEEEMRSQQRWKKQLAAMGFEEIPEEMPEEMSDEVMDVDTPVAN